jgi:hypothetical protein
MTTTVTQLNTVDIVTQFGGGVSSIASNYTGSILYGAFQQVTGRSIIISTDGGINWTTLSGAASSGLTNARLTSIACSQTGSTIYTTWQGGNLYSSTDSGATFNPLFTTGFLGGETYANPTRLACDSTGTQILMSTGNGTRLYVSRNSGASVTTVIDVSAIPFSPVAMNSNGSALYAVLNAPGGYQGVYTDQDSWTTPLFTTTTNDPILSLSCSPTGSTILVTVSGRGLYVIQNGSIAGPITGTSTFGIVASYNNGKKFLEFSPNMTTYAINPGPVVCFGKGAKILCLQGGQEVYRPVEDIRSRDLVKTLLHGYVPVNMIGYSELNQSKDVSDEDRLYVCSPGQYPSVIEDLILTGFHSILVDPLSLSDDEKESIKRVLGRIFRTDDKYRLPVCLDKRASVYMGTDIHTIYHLALDNDNYYSNYGIYANGLLVESCSKRFLKELSNMTLL